MVSGELQSWIEGPFTKEYEAAEAKAEAIAKRHKARLAVLERRLDLPPQLLTATRQRLEATYQAEIGKVQEPLRVGLSSQRGEIERRRNEAMRKQAERLKDAFRDVPAGAIEVFKAQVGQMTDAERLEVFRYGQDWQKEVIATWFRPEAKKREGHLPEPLAPEAAELQGLIDKRNWVARHDEDLAHLADLERELEKLDLVKVWQKQAERFNVEHPLSFSEVELAQANAEVVREIEAAKRELG